MQDTPVALGQATLADVWLDADTQSPDALWERVDRELDQGHGVWLTGASFDKLARQFGRAQAGRRWIAIRPRRAARAEALYRARDVVLSGTALLLLSPLFPLAALLIKRSSPGPVFYSTAVVGKARTHFVWRKLRSMRPMSRRDDERTRRQKFRAYAQGRVPGKVIADERVTPIGKLLRKYSLDELPQLWNVLRGEMTLVGPRPCLPYEAEEFPAWGRRRFGVRPGLTGVWQVLGRGRVSLDELLTMDVYYTYARSFWFDARVMLLTLGVVFSGTGGE